MAHRDVVSRVWTLAESVVSVMGVEIVDIEHSAGRKRQVVRLFIDKPGGVGLADCERVSRELEGRLDAEGAIGAPYALEVSSPGMERPLRRAADFRRYVGRRIRLRLRASRGMASKVSGILRGIEGGVITIETGEGAERLFSLEEVARANLEVDWEAEFRRKTGPGEPTSDRARDGGVSR